MKIHTSFLKALALCVGMTGCQKADSLRKATPPFGLEGNWELTDTYCSNGDEPSYQPLSDMKKISMEVLPQKIVQLWQGNNGQSQTAVFNYKVEGRKLILDYLNAENSEQRFEKVSFKIAGGRNLVIIAGTNNCEQSASLVTVYKYLGKSQGQK